MYLTGNIHLQRAALALLVSIALCFSTPAQEEPENSSDEAIGQFNEAQALHEKGKFEDAIKLYDKAIALVAEFPEAEYQRGDALLSLGRIDDAEKSVRLAVEHRADWSLALAKLGEILVKRLSAAPETESGTLRQEAARILQRAIELDKSNFPAHTALVELRLASNESEPVLQSTLRSLKEITDGKMKAPAAIWAARAAVEDRLKLRDASRVSIKAALDADPKSKSAIRFATQLALNDGDTELASERLKALKSLGDNSHAAQLLEVRVLAAEGKFVEARSLLDASNVKSADAEKLKTELAANSSISTAELEALVEKDPRNVTYLSRLCEKHRVSSPEKALDFCRRAAEADPENIAHAVGFGAALVQTKRFDQASILLYKLLAFAPDNTTARVNLAMSYYQLKKFPEAKAQYEWIVNRHPEKPIAHFFLAVTHDNLGEYLDAMANYQQFLRIADPKVNQIEIEKVNLRIPSLQKLIKSGKGRK